MIVVLLSADLYQQLAQTAVGLACMEQTQQEVRFAAAADSPLASLLQANGWLATPEELAAAQAAGSWTVQHWANAANAGAQWPAHGVLEGEWSDPRIFAPGLARLAALLTSAISQGLQLSPLAPEDQDTAPWVAVDARTLQGSNAVAYVQDALAECRHRLPQCRIQVLGDDAPLRNAVDCTALQVHTLALSDFASELHALVYLAHCKAHVVMDRGLGYWAALLATQFNALTVAPMQVLQSAAVQAHPQWPAAWVVMPTMLSAVPFNPDTLPAPLGIEAVQRPIRVGVTGCYEHIVSKNYLFTNMQVANGHNSLKPWCDLHAYGQRHGIEFVTLDRVADIANDMDVVVVSDRHKPGNALAEAALQANVLKILLIYECPLIKPDNWDVAYHQQFDYIFTWNDELVDGRRYIKNNFVSDCRSPYDFEVLQAAFAQRKLLTMINSCVIPANPEQFPTQLYTHRVRTIRWYEANQPAHFDLYGMGWDAAQYPSYRGTARDKLAVLSHYRFAICYENAQSYPGYISEKMQDCLLAGVVPVYGGAPNVADWIPRDCYIDISSFASYADLHQFLSQMTHAEHDRYLHHIRDFLQTKKSYAFSSACFIHTLASYIAWGVGHRRALLDSGTDANAQANAKHLASQWLQQDKRSLELKIQPEVQVQVNTAKAPEHTAPPVAALTPRQAAFELRQDDLIVAFGYGPELPVFMRARGLWQFYASHFPHIRFVFMRSTHALERGQVVCEGEDLLIGMGNDAQSIEAAEKGRASGYANGGVWSSIENENNVFRQVCLYEYLLRRERKPFRLYAPTITSIVDFRALAVLLNHLPKDRLFAGMPGTLRHPPYEGVGMVHGGNTLVSSDVMELMRDRYVAGHEYTQQPNDHWQGLILKDIPRVALPLFSFNAARDEDAPYDDIGRLVASLLGDGHYHFRIKTASRDPLKGRREDVDPWLMLKAADTVLRTPTRPDRVLDLFERFGKCCEPALNYPRNFPIDDSETQHFYR